MPEPIRLVIWDLDETFWSGTLTEGGITWNQAAHDTVVELARRGIMSGICSKNDHGAVEAILRERGTWDYFIFPSINWEPKGPRIAALIEAVQLRPESVLFMDDNHLNLKEAQHFVPALQVAPHTFLADMLSSPLLKGKHDPDLTRLNQYKLLERRKADETSAITATGGNLDFLRSCDIRVRIERDVERYLDRAVELVNRTNQLNFTKRRLPEEPEEARAALRQELEHHMVQAGLIEVSDRYGNYGYCGFYLVRSLPEGDRLMHFCFSCRILNMGVEAWLYQRLGRPGLTVRGHVLSDPVGAKPVDWITAVLPGSVPGRPGAGRDVAFSSVSARGGCVLMPLMHYLGMNSSTLVGEFNIVRDGVTVRLDHTLCFRHALKGLPPEAIKAFEPLGYREDDFRTEFFAHKGPNPIYVFSNWADLGLSLFRHKATDVVIPFRDLPDARQRTPAMRDAARYLAEAFTPLGIASERRIKRNLRAIFSRVPRHGRLFALLAMERHVGPDGTERILEPRRRLNAWTAEVAREFPNVTTLRIEDHVRSAADVKAGSAFGHFDRMVYFRLYQAILDHVGGQATNLAAAEALT